MASAVYPSALDAILTAGVNLSSADIRATLVTAGYTYSSAHDFYDDVVAGNRLSEFTLASKTVSGGVFDAADGTWTAVTGSAGVAIVLRVYNATESASRLLAYIDGFSVTPNGGNITCAWDNGTNKILKFG